MYNTLAYVNYTMQMNELFCNYIESTVSTICRYPVFKETIVYGGQTRAYLQ